MADVFSPLSGQQALPMEFHVSRRARDRYQFDESLFSINGNVIFANFHAARLFAQKINDKRDLARYPEQAVMAGQINAMGLIDEILHFSSTSTASSATLTSWPKRWTGWSSAWAPRLSSALCTASPTNFRRWLSIAAR